MIDMNFFASTEHLQPKCGGCSCSVEYGVTTKFDENLESHVCVQCGCTL